MKFPQPGWHVWCYYVGLVEVTILLRVHGRSISGSYNSPDPSSHVSYASGVRDCIVDVWGSL